MTRVRLAWLIVPIGCVLMVGAVACVAATRDYAVEVSAMVHESRPRVDFTWRADATATGYRVFKKAIGDTAWGDPIAVLSGTATSLSDAEVDVGEAYEYGFYKTRNVISDTVQVVTGSSLTFTIFDSWGDGICCDHSLGSYRVSGCDSVYASGGAFGSFEATSFFLGTPESPCSSLVVGITLDIFSDETTWKLKDNASGQILAQGGPYVPPKFGHIFAGIRYPMPESFGTVLLVVDEDVADSLASEIGRLELDMIRDGYRVVRRDAPASASVPDVKSLIVSECQANLDISTLFLLGSIAIPYSGDIRGAHSNEWGAWAADVYYGDLDGAWTDSTVNNTSASRLENHNVPGDGKFDETYLPSPVDLQVGRVDLSCLPAFAESEVELLRRYLDKDHAFRTGAIPVPRRGLIKDGTGDLYGTAYACTGWRNYTAMFGLSGVTTGAWLPTLETTPYLCAFGSGPGSFTACSGVISTTDFATKSIYAVFTMLMGSYFGEWDTSNNLLRASLASQGYSLACFWAGRPAWHLHHMALGWPIGYSTRLTQNNHTLYMIGYGGMQIHIALMGDPTLRLHVVKPPKNFSLECGAGGGIHLRWRAPADSVIGYHVYRAEAIRGDFSRLNPSIVEDTTFFDSAPLSGWNTYMVRAAKLETTGSGTYLNLSSGASDSIDATAGVDPAQPAVQGGQAGVGGSPNPFLAGTRIGFHLVEPSRITVRVHDVTGRLVRAVDAGWQPAGEHTFEWDGKDGQGNRVASGVYYLSVDTERGSFSTKVVKIE